MFGLSFGEILIVLVVALLVLGPERLPKVAKSVGKGMRDLRRTTGGIREILEDEIYLDEAVDRRPPPREADSEAPGPIPRGPAHVAPQAEARAEAKAEDAPATAEPNAEAEPAKAEAKRGVES